MSYNGSGTFVINSTGQPVVTGTVISSTAFNSLTSDLATGLSTAITTDGQSATSVRIPFAAGINSSLTTDAISIATGSIITAGGVGIAKALWVGGLANIAGVLTTIAQTITSASANAFAVGRVGTTNPAFNIDASTALSATGVNIKAAAAAGGVAVSVLSSGANEALTVNAKGSGAIGIGSISTGAVTITPATTISGAATLSSTLGVTGATTLSSTLGVTGVATLGNGAILGTPASATLTNATGLPISSGVSGLGTGVATALAVNVGSAGAPVVNGGALGTPASGTVTNLTGTASININGTVGATTPAAVAATTLAASGVTTVQAGSAAAPAITTSGDTNTGIFFPAADTIAFGEGGVEAMRIDSSGNVGIGATSPNASANTTIKQGSSTYQLQLEQSNATDGYGLRCNASDGDLTFSRYESSAYTERMRLTASGNVGIGTASPGAKLDINAGGTTKIYIGANTSNANYNAISLNSNNADSARIGMTGGGSGDNALYLDANANINFRPSGSATIAVAMLSGGNVGIGTTGPAYQLQLSTDSAGKPGTGGLWTVVSDERIKSNIVPANLDRCYEIVKSVPLKHFGFAPGVYTDDQINDKHNLGWIAQDVQKVFKNAVSVKPFTLKTDILDGTEEYQEQDFTLETVEKLETCIQVIDGKPVQVSKAVTSENKVLLFDTVDVLDEAGDAVMDGDKPLTHQMPRMITKTRPKVRHDVIEDCLDLNSGQMIAALYGAVQSLMATVEAQAAKITQLELAGTP